MHSIGHVDVEGVRNERKITQGKSRNTKKKLWQQQKNRSPFFSRAKHKFLQKRNTTAHFSVHIHCAMGSSGETQPFHSNERQMHAWRKNILVKHKKGLLDTADPCSRTDRTMETMTVCAIAFTSTGKTAFFSLFVSLRWDKTMNGCWRYSRETEEHNNIFLVQYANNGWLIFICDNIFFVLRSQPACCWAS